MRNTENEMEKQFPGKAKNFSLRKFIVRWINSAIKKTARRGKKQHGKSIQTKLAVFAYRHSTTN